jgi:hypothetical protein
MRLSPSALPVGTRNQYRPILEGEKIGLSVGTKFGIFGALWGVVGNGGEICC